MFKKIAFLFGLLFTSTMAFGAYNPATPVSVPTVAAMQALGAASAQYGHVIVQGLSTGSSIGGGSFDWYDVCPTTPDSVNYVAATGVSTTKCWVRSGAPMVVVNPTAYGAKCDGTTDDSTAFQAALNSVGPTTYKTTAFMIPASGLGCKLGTLVTYDLTVAPLLIAGEGPNAKLLVAAAAGGMKVSGSCGVARENFYISDLTFVISRGIGNTAVYGLRLDGVSGFGVGDVNFIPGSGVFTHALELMGSSQGYVHGGTFTADHTAIYITRCTGAVGILESNAVDIGAGMAINTDDFGIVVEAAPADLWIHGIHITSSDIGIRFNQDGNIGPNYVSDIHTELNSTVGLQIAAGTVIARSINDYNTQSITVAGSATLTLRDSNLNGSVITSGTSRLDMLGGNSLLGAITYGASTSGTISENTISGSLTNNTGGNLMLANNRGLGPVVGSNVATTELSARASFNGTEWARFDASGIKTTTNLLTLFSASPTIGTCGSSPSVGTRSVNNGGSFTTGTGSPTACSIAFSSPAPPSNAYCTVTPANAAAVATTVYVSSSSSSGFTITLGAGTSSAAYNYTCAGID